MRRIAHVSNLTGAGDPHYRRGERERIRTLEAGGKRSWEVAMESCQILLDGDGDGDGSRTEESRQESFKKKSCVWFSFFIF